MAASTAPAARAKVLELLQARAGLSGVQITWAPPTQEEDISAEMIYLGGRVERTLEPISLGGLRFDETYTFDVLIDFEQDGDDPRTCEARGWALVNEVEQSIRANPTLESVLNQDAELGESTVEAVPVQGAWRCTATVPVTCNARI